VLGGLFVYPTGTLRSTALRWDSEAKRKGSADEKVGEMTQERDITGAYRCDDHEPQDTKIRAFVPPRPRDRHKPKKSDSRAGYWCRRTAFLAKKVAVATREAREAKDMIQAMEKQMKEMKQLLTAPLRQGVLQRNLGVRRLQAAIRGHRDRQRIRVLGAEQAADTQELLAPPEQAADAQRAQAASPLQQLQAVMSLSLQAVRSLSNRGRHEFVERHLGLRRLQAAIRGHRDRQRTRMLSAQNITEERAALVPLLSVFGGRSPVAHGASTSSNCPRGGCVRAGPSRGRGLAE